MVGFPLEPFPRILRDMQLVHIGEATQPNTVLALINMMAQQEHEAVLAAKARLQNSSSPKKPVSR